MDLVKLTSTLGVFGPVAVFLRRTPVQSGRAVLQVPHGAVTVQVRAAVARHLAILLTATRTTF